MRTRSEVQTDILALGVRKEELLNELDQVRMAEDPATRYQSDLQEAMEKDANRRYGDLSHRVPCDEFDPTQGYVPRSSQARYRDYYGGADYENRGYRRRYPQLEHPDRVRDAYAQTVGGGDSFSRRVQIWAESQMTPVHKLTQELAMSDEKIARLNDEIEQKKAALKVVEHGKILQQKMLEIAIQAEDAVKATLPPKPPYDDSGR